MWWHDTAIFTLLYLILLTVWFFEIFKLIFPTSSSWHKAMYAEHWRKLAWATPLGNFSILLVQSFCGALVNSCLLEYANVFPIKNKFSHLTSHFEFFWFSFSTWLSKMELLFLNLYTSPRWGTLKFKWFPSVKFWYTMWM